MGEHKKETAKEAEKEEEKAEAKNKGRSCRTLLIEFAFMGTRTR